MTLRPFAACCAIAFASCAGANEELRIVDCSYTTECNLSSAECVSGPDEILSFTLVMETDGDEVWYEGERDLPPMKQTFTEDGVMVVHDARRSTLTSIGANGVSVHSSNLILLASQMRASQWAGTCRTR
ncbi:hypothetical protein JI664_23125 [Rhodobacter sp. NTK016B]|uniref:hypothetical protein n=1 Tax=Rhodobacter sp. NTK016B TaxID=2759676 RepID=UPI001A8FE93E|nr:hypothetical protein [Rhodobacter sp. NTK016B]MBN8294882.1 hypothetical protein [Rhodobacter sp. NTK016B]